MHYIVQSKGHVSDTFQTTDSHSELECSMVIIKRKIYDNYRKLKHLISRTVYEF